MTKDTGRARSASSTVQSRFVSGLYEVQPLGNTVCQRSRHRPIAVVRQHDPEDRPCQSGGLIQRKAGSAPALDFVDAALHQVKRIITSGLQPVTQGLHAFPPRLPREVHWPAAVEASKPHSCPRSASSAIHLGA